MTRLILLAVLVVGCSPMPLPMVDAGEPFDAGSYTPVEARRLGLNDATYLLPLSSPDAGSGFPSAEAMIPRVLFDRVSTTPGDVITDLSRLRIVALRFDICDRATTAPCAETADGVIRLVLQPTFNDGSVEDVAFHAFYPVPRNEVYEAVDTLRALARLQNVPTGSALRVNRAFGADAEFTSKLAAFVRRYAVAARIFRLTLFGQMTNRAALIWVFRGMEKRGAGFVRIEIPDLMEIDQVSLLFSATEFQTMPQADEPKGFSRAMSLRSFMDGTAAEKREALESLVASDNPTLNTADTIQCITCHVSTTILPERAMVAGVDVTTLAGRYTSTQFDLTPIGDVALRFRTLRALGYLRNTPLVAQRTVNETANVIGELEVRYPPAP